MDVGLSQLEARFAMTPVASGQKEMAVNKEQTEWTWLFFFFKKITVWFARGGGGHQMDKRNKDNR